MIPIEIIISNFLVNSFIGLLIASLLRGYLIFHIDERYPVRLIGSVLLGAISAFPYFFDLYEFIFLYYVILAIAVLLLNSTITFLSLAPLLYALYLRDYLNLYSLLSLTLIIIIAYMIRHTKLTPLAKVIWTLLSAVLLINGELLYYHVMPQQILISNGVAAFFVLAFYFICVLIQKYNTVFKFYMNTALYDPITQLPNKNYFQENFEGKKTKHSLAMVDIDNFRNIEALYGYTITNKIIHHLAEELIMYFGEHGNLFHHNSDRFYIVFSSKDEDHVINDFNHFRQRIERETFEIDGNQIHMTISLGVMINHKKMRTEELVKSCYEALKTSKITGRNRMTIH